MKPGPQLPAGWQAKFLEAYRTRGGLWRAAEAANVAPDTVRRYREQDPDFDQQVLHAREYFADLTAERMLDLGERSDNPVPHIVRLKALRPAEYIEKHAVMNLQISADLPPFDAAALLHAMLGHATDATRALLQHGPPALEPHDATPSEPPSD